MTRYRWRIVALLMALVIATSAFVGGGSVALGQGPGTMIAVTGGYKDPNCGTSNQTYDVRMYRDTQYGGTMWRFCAGGWPDLCWAPHGSDSSDALLCGAGFDGDTANDYGSSVKVISVTGGSTCRVEFRENTNYGGGIVSYWDPVWVPSWVPFPNDQVSSLRRVC